MIPQPIDQVPLFLRLSEEERELLSSRLRHLEFNTNDVILTAGKPAEMMAVIAQGWVKLSSDSPQGHVALANLGAGSVIGEVDLLLNQPYSTTARAASATNLLVLYHQDLQEVILQRPTIGLSFSASLGARVAYLDEYLVTQRLLTIPLLSALSEDELRALANKLEFQTIQRGQTLFEAGAAGDAVFLIESGTARLITPSHEGETFEELQPGAMLGQTALITGKPYSASALAVTDLNIWVLTRTDYQELVHNHPTIQVAFSRALAETLGHDDQAKAVEQLRALPLFSDVETEALRDIAACLVLRHFPAGEQVYTEGTPGDAMYLIESGQVRLASNSSVQARTLEIKGEGSAFGEMALLTGRTRAEAARAVEDTTVWVLYKNAYDDLIVRHPSLSLALSRALSGRLSSSEGDQIENQLYEYKLLNGLSQFEMKHVGEFIKPLRFRTGESICFAGQNAQYIYLISKGEVREIAGGPNGQAVVLALHQEHESFGERAVVQNAAYPTTMQAVGDVECLTLAKPDFDRLVTRYPTLALNLARRMADEAERAGQRPGARMAPPAPPRANPQPTAARAITYPGAPRTPTQRPISPPRTPTMAQPVLVESTASVVGIRTAPGKPWERPSSNVVRPMPAANSRPIAVSGVAPSPMTASTTGMPGYSAPRYRQPSGGLLSQLTNMSAGGKIKLAVIALSAIVVMLIVMVALVYWAVSSVAASSAPSSPGLPLNVNDATTKRVALAPITGKWAIKERTATPTLMPATPIPAALPTKIPTKKPAAIVPKAITKSVALAAPTQTLVAAPAQPVRLPLAPRIWDKRLGAGGLPLLLGVGVTEANVPSGTKFWRLTKMVFQDAGAESGNDHTIYISIFDENGQRVNDQTVLISWDQGGAVEEQRLGLPDQKPQGDFCNCNYNWPMWGAGYRVRIDGSIASDQPYGMIMPEHRHVNYLLTFQLVTMP
ncbi:MAG: cyclic nucleotide-binding domain-containing protein [Anaerolineae bacterium]